ncbi:hypothetical protein [Limibacillus sp. MBR-115]|jgi:hypothetical protein|uniref:hypothetical protein n=1 Tax=Limibacillus sp. MBR-115 TaxID=3156465 RepID=UPI0033939E95
MAGRYEIVQPCSRRFALILPRQEFQKHHVHSPAFTLTLGPPGRPAAPHKAANRHISETKRALEEEENKRTVKTRPVNLMEEFARAAGDDDDGGGGGGGDTGGPKPPTKPRGPDKPKGPKGQDGPDRPNRRPRRKRKDRDFDRGM